MATSIAELARAEKLHTHSITQSPSLFDVAETKALASEYVWFIVLKNQPQTFHAKVVKTALTGIAI